MQKLFVICLLASPFLSLAQNRVPAFEMSERLGRGVNMGNSFEAPTETEWGNPWKPEYFKIMHQLGFNHVRVPIRWETSARSMATPPYTIAPEFLDRIQEVVDSARRYKLHIIINMHHHDALYEDPAGQKDRFLSQWYQIADHFKNYSDSLLFEVLNEPHGNITPQIWNEYFAAALTEIRKTNPTRVVLMGVAEYGGLGAISQLQLPNDEYIIVSPHYYNPFNFTHQGAEWVSGADAWLGTEWMDTEADRQTVESEFSYALQFSQTNHVPIHVGEFGAYNKADIESRERWTTFLSRWYEEQGLSWAYWEFSAGFGIYNPTTKQFVEPLVDALLHNEMPEPTPIYATPIYTSNFSNGTDGWSLSAQGGGAGSIATSGGKLNVTITNGGTESWHVQLVKSNIRLEHDKLYRISFKGKAAADRSVTFYAGKASDPWNAYSGYNGISVGTAESSFTFSFTMTNPTDPAARLVFDLGKSATGITLWDIKVEELSFTDPNPPVTAIEETNPQKEVYPNPVTSWLNINQTQGYQKGILYDLTGKPIIRFDISPELSRVNLGSLSNGMYVLYLQGKGGKDWVKIVKQ